MKFTKILILILALSMLLVSCGGNGDGTVTTKPDSTTETLGNTTSTADSTTEPDGTTEAPDSSVTPPETNVPDIDWIFPTVAHEHEYVKFNGEMIDLCQLDGTYPVTTFCPDYFDASFLVNSICKMNNGFIIQFTATDYAELYDLTGKSSELINSTDKKGTGGGKIRGTVDKVYYQGEMCDLSDGQIIDLTLQYCIYRKNDKTHIGVTSAYAPIFRKGYSYIAFGTYRDDGLYFPQHGFFELSAEEDLIEYYSKIGWFDEGYVYMFNTREDYYDIFRLFPPVEPTKLEN